MGLKKKIVSWIDKKLTKFLDKILGELNIDISEPDTVIQPETPIETPAVTPEPTPVQPTPSQPEKSDDEVAYEDLNFCWGGFKKKDAYIVSLIENLSVNKNGLSYKWKSGGCEKMGASDKDDASATLSCFFCKIGGKWVGGKHDWLSSSRTTRDFKNIREGYNGWSKTAIEDASEYAFCIVSYKNNTRTNVIHCSRSFKSQSAVKDSISIVKTIISFFVKKSERKTEKKDKIMEQIEQQKSELKKALADGRITDAGSISKTIEKLYKKFNKVGIFSLLTLVLSLCGCSSGKIHQEYNPPSIIGERIYICNPGETMQIPKLVEPATKWYLIDNIGLTQWLGIPESAQP